MPVVAYLSDHKAETLDSVVRAWRASSPRRTDTAKVQFLLGRRQRRHRGGDQHRGRARPTARCCCYVYAAVIVLCFLTFRSWRAVRGGRDPAGRSPRSCARR